MSQFRQRLGRAALDAFAEANGLMSELPEPTSGALVLLAAMGTMARRRRSCRSEANGFTPITAAQTGLTDHVWEMILGQLWSDMSKSLWGSDVDSVPLRRWNRDDNETDF